MQSSPFSLLVETILPGKNGKRFQFDVGPTFAFLDAFPITHPAQTNG
jgi:hypothetical protein